MERLSRNNLRCQLDHLVQTAFHPEQADLGVHGPAVVLRLGVLEQRVIDLARPFNVHRVAGLDPADLLDPRRKEVRPHRFTEVELVQRGDALIELAVFEETAGVVTGHPNQQRAMHHPLRQLVSSYPAISQAGDSVHRFDGHEVVERPQRLVRQRVLLGKAERLAQQRDGLVDPLQASKHGAPGVHGIDGHFDIAGGLGRLEHCQGNVGGLLVLEGAHLRPRQLGAKGHHLGLPGTVGIEVGRHRLDGIDWLIGIHVGRS